MDRLQESAAALLLRSPRLSVSTVLELLDISDSEFRALVQEVSMLLAYEVTRDFPLGTVEIEGRGRKAERFGRSGAGVGADG